MFSKKVIVSRDKFLKYDLRVSNIIAVFIFQRSLINFRSSFELLREPTLFLKLD